MTVMGYLTRLFLIRFLSALLALAVLLQLLDLFENAGTVLARPAGILDMPVYLAMRFPLLMLQVMSLAVLIGATTSFLALVMRNEVVALRAAGYMPLLLPISLLPAALLLAAAQFVLADQAAPRLERRLIVWNAEAEPPQEPAPDRRFWMRSGPDIISFTKTGEQGRKLMGVTILHRDEKGNATARTTAAEAAWEDGSWTLTQAHSVILAANGSRIQSWDRLALAEGPEPRDILEVQAPTPHLPLAHLMRIAEGRLSGPQTQASYEVKLHQAFAQPLSLVLMLLLAAPAMHGMSNRVFGWEAGLATVSGLSFLVVDGIFASLGHGAVLVPVAAVWTAPALFAAGGAALLLALEG